MSSNDSRALSRVIVVGRTEHKHETPHTLRTINRTTHTNALRTMDDGVVLTMAQTLESETVRLNQELRTISNDMEIVSQKITRYGDVFLQPLQYLAQLRQHKELRLQEISNQMGALQAQLDNSAHLLAILQNAGRTATVVRPASPSVRSKFASMSPNRRIVP